MKCNKQEVNSTLFTINYKKELVKFKTDLFSKRKMNLNEFAIVVLGINPISTEIIAMYIGKMGFDTYNKGLYDITITKKNRNGIQGRIRYNEK